MRRRTLVLLCIGLIACGASRPSPAPASTVEASAPAPQPAPSAPASAGVEQLPARAPLVARIDVQALRELELLALFASALSLSDADEAALEAAPVAFLSVEPAQD